MKALIHLNFFPEVKMLTITLLSLMSKKSTFNKKKKIEIHSETYAFIS